MRALIPLLAFFFAVPALAQPRAPVLTGEFHGVVSARDQNGVLSLTPALSAAERRDVMKLTNGADPAVYQSGLTVREVHYEIGTGPGARIAEVCSGPCQVTGVIEWREPNDWWFKEVRSAVRLPADYDFALLSRAVVAPTGERVSLRDLPATDPLTRSLSEALQADMEAEIGQPLRFETIVVRRQDQFVYLVVKPTHRDGGQVDFASTRWRDQHRYGPWDGGYIHALFRQDGERWTRDTFLISPVTDGSVTGWAVLYRAPAGLFRGQVRRDG